MALGELFFGEKSSETSEQKVRLEVNTDDKAYPPVPERDISLTVTPQKTETAIQALTTLSASELVDKFESVKIEFGRAVNKEGRQFGRNDPGFIEHNKLSLQSYNVTSEAFEAKEDVFSKDPSSSNNAKGILIAQIEKMQSTLERIEARLDATTSYADSPRPM